MTTSAARRALACAAALALVSFRGPDPAADVGGDWPQSELRSGGRPVTAALRAGEVHRYRLPLAKGTVLRLVVDQQGIDLVVALEDPAGAKVLEADRLINDRGPELVLAVAATNGVHTLLLRGPEKAKPGRYEARIEALRPASEADRRSAATYRSFTAAARLPPGPALAAMTRALATWRELGEVALEAEALDSMARVHHRRGEYRQGAEMFNEAADAFARAGDHRWEAIARNSAAADLLALDAAQEAVPQYERALTLARQTDDRRTQAQALHGLGQIAQEWGELQLALDRYQDALVLLPKENRNVRPYILHNLGVLYSELGDDNRAGELLLETLDAWLPENAAAKAGTLSQLGQIAYEQGRVDEAGQRFRAALQLDSHSCSSVVMLARLALVEQSLNEPAAADERLAEALRIVQSRSCLRSASMVFLYQAAIAQRRGDGVAARAAYQHSEGLFAVQGDRMGSAQSLARLARSERALGHRPAALRANRRALDVFEGVRPTVLREDLRMSFFATAQSLFDFQIDLLLEMGKKEEAWAAAEQARARALGDLLAEKGAHLRRDAPPTLAEKERELQRQLNFLESKRLATSEEDANKLRSLRQRIESLTANLESVRGELRRRSPRWASLTGPEPVSLTVVRRELLDGETALLEYRLGEPQSTLWVIARDALAVARLPPRRELERLAREAESQLGSVEWPGSYSQSLCELSRKLLGPATQALAHRRLVVVPDGALAALPFSALPDPADPAVCAKAPALVANHEIAYLPSVATLLVQRRRQASRPPAARWLAEVADPVYEPGDPRLAGRVSDDAVSRDADLPLLHRLPGSGEEAAAIAKLLPADKVLVETGFDASRQTVAGGALAGYRILHFAVHGIFDAEQPLLSGLALSLRDAAGRPIAGFLPAAEIYGFDLPTELVTLSACETARGREIPGEGLVSGLPRAFLYAGAARALVSLWKVDDRSTRDLMLRFYRGLFERSLAPAQALQEAQRGLLNAGWPPRQWAGFVLLGDWRPLPPFSR